MKLRMKAHEVKTQLGWLNAYAAQEAAYALERAAANCVQKDEAWSNELAERFATMLADLRQHVERVDAARLAVLDPSGSRTASAPSGATGRQTSSAATIAR